MGWGAAIIEQGGGFIKQGVGAPSSSREKGTQFCFGQHLPCEIGLKPAQQAHRPFFRATGRGPGIVPGGLGTRAAGHGPAGHGPAASLRAIGARNALTGQWIFGGTAWPADDQLRTGGPRYTGHGSGAESVHRAA